MDGEDFLISTTVQEVFKNCEILGWYSTSSSAPTEEDLAFHRGPISTWNSSPLYLRLDPTAQATAKELPLEVYESQVQLVDGVATLQLVPCTFKLEAQEVERVIVDHMAKITGQVQQGAPESASLISLRDAVRSLQTRVQILLTYLTDATQRTPFIVVMVGWRR